MTNSTDSTPAMAAETPSFADATAITAQSSHTYTASFPSGWAIGSVPHGGLVASCFMKVASEHFNTTHAAQNQPHTIAMHLHFVRRTEVGPALFTVKDVKLGAATSTLHIELSQDIGGSGEADSATRRVEVLGYLTRSNIRTETGPTFSTDWALHPVPPPGIPSSFQIQNGRMVDPAGNWVESPGLPFANFRKATRPVRFLFPAGRKVPEGNQRVRASADQWMSLRSGENFTNDSLGFVCDMFPQVIATLLAQEHGRDVAAQHWFPTVLLNLEVKKALPEEGVRWLFLRCRAKVVRNGRYDLEVVIQDEEGEVVGLSHHICLLVDAKRNLKQRSGREKNDESKL